MTRYAAFLALAALWLAMLLLGGAHWAADRALLALLYAGDNPALTALARFVTELGGWRVLVPAALIAACFLLYRGERRRALLLVAIALGGRLLIDIQKWLTARVRPPEEDRLVEVLTLSFPSGHAANAAITWLAIALLLSGRRAAILAALLLALAIGLSRIVLGVHWPSDVAGGWAFGLLWTLGLVRFAEPKGTPPPPPSLKASKETIMADTKRPDDSELIDSMEDAPSQGGRSGGNLQRDIATQAEEEHLIDGKTGVTRVRKEDKPNDGDRPNLPNRV